MRTFLFTSYVRIEAENEDEAKTKFANDSYDFAYEAECEDITDLENQIK